MARRTIRIITVSREFGAGGSELAERLGRVLGWLVLDRDIIHRVAEQLRLEDDTVDRFDEHTPGLIARIATVLTVPQGETYSFAPVDMPTHDAIAHATRKVILDAAGSPPLIVVGHGAQCILSGRDDAIHVRVVAPIAERMARVVRRLGVSESAAPAVLKRADQERQSYVQRYFNRDWRSELLYDVQINTGKVSIDDAATLVSGLVERPETASV